MHELENFFKALADASRLRIVNLLSYGELCGCDIQHVLDAPQPNVSRHLTYLKHAGLVLDRREGNRIFFRLVAPAGETLGRLFEFLRAAFLRDEVLRADLVRLRQAIQAGACTIQQIRPLPRVATAGQPRHASG